MIAARLPKDDLDWVLSLTASFWQQYGNSRLFITGGTGWIGRWLLEVVQHANIRLNAGIEVLVLTRDPTATQRRLGALCHQPGLHLLAGDLSGDLPSPGSFDLCIHAATDVGTSMLAADPLQVFDSIVNGTRQILDLALAAGASRFLLTSSGAVYGAQPPHLDLLPESYLGAPNPLDPHAAYGNGKRAAEWLTATYALRHPGTFFPCIARIFALIGPGMPLDGKFAAGNFVRDVLGQNTIHIESDGRPIRSYLYMADLIVWLLRLLERGKPGEAYNVGSEHPISILDLAHAVNEMAQTNCAIEIKQQTTSSASPARYLPNTQKARSTLDLKEWNTLEAALRKTIAWSREGNHEKI